MSDDKGKELLENAYKLATPNDNVAYYRELSATYDRDFVDGLGFALPDEVVRVFLQRSNDDAPIADLGCGTGLVGVALKDHGHPVDGLDISREMLEIARSKSVYRDLVQIDLTTDISRHASKYGAVLSSGTFTHGHLGPDSLKNALLLGKPNALFVVSINLVHFSRLGFETSIEGMVEDGTIHSFKAEEVSIYSKLDHEHSNDRAAIISFRKS